LTEILNQINESGLSPNQFFLLYAIKNRLELKNIDTEKEKAYLEDKGYLTDELVLNDIFEYQREEEEFNKKATAFQLIFPLAIIPTSRIPARAKKSQVRDKLKAFLKLYKYDWDVIYAAAEQYVDRYKADDYRWMQTASTFILDKNGDSALATECDIIGYNRKELYESI
jgi:hypothetical protein